MGYITHLALEHCMVCVSKICLALNPFTSLMISSSPNIPCLGLVTWLGPTFASSCF